MYYILKELNELNTEYCDNGFHWVYIGNVIFNNY